MNGVVVKTEVTKDAGIIDRLVAIYLKKKTEMSKTKY